MKLKTWFAVGILTLPVFLMSGDLLVRIDRSDCSDLAEGTDLRVFMESEGRVLLKLDGDIVNELLSAGKYCEIIDDDADGKDYYLYSGKQPAAFAKSDMIRIDGEHSVLAVSASDNVDRPSGPYTLLKEHRLAADTSRSWNISGMEGSEIGDLIEDLKAQIHEDSLAWFVQGLQDFRTRYWEDGNRRQVADWIRKQFLRMGFAPENVLLDSFLYNHTWQYNVIATIPGNYRPDRHIILGGHHDSITMEYPVAQAPGADDNASGCAAALETARILMTNGYVPEESLHFATWAAEEVGLVGSGVFAEKIALQGWNVTAYLNNDMIANNHLQPAVAQISLRPHSGAEFLADIARYAAESYTDLDVSGLHWNQGSSDHWSFYMNDLPAIGFMETDFSPYYHTRSDLIDYLDLQYFRQTTSLSLAMVLILDQTPPAFETFTLWDRGDGAGFSVKPDLSFTQPDFHHFNIYTGHEPGLYDSVVQSYGEETVFTVQQIGSTVYAAVSEVDADGNEGFLTEKAITLTQFPRIPAGLQAGALPGSIRLNWAPNYESDLAAYVIDRKTADGAVFAEYVELNRDLNSWIDTDVESGIFYEYRISAVDSEGNKSPASEPVSGRAVTLDGGILIMNMCAVADDPMLNPDNSEAVAALYRLLAGYRLDTLLVLPEQNVNLSDLGYFSTLIITKNSWGYGRHEDFYQILPALKDYLDFGGNVIYSGFRPMDFFAGEDRYDEFGAQIAKVHFGLVNSVSGFGSFSRAVPEDAGFIPMRVDSARAVAGFNYHIFGVDGLTADSSAQVIYSFGSEYPENVSQGSMNGMTVGIMKKHASNTAILCSFPFYYMNDIGSRAFFDAVLPELGEINALSLEPSWNAAQPELISNFPNPFNAATRINWSMSRPGITEITVYDILGRKIVRKELGSISPGSYSYEWNSLSQNGQSCGSGIYFAVVSSGGKAFLYRKMLLIK